MRWWLRWILTLALGPLVWWVLTGYVATQQGTSFAQWLADVPKPSAYLILTLPAALLCLVLMGLDRMLTLISLDLLTVVLSPLVGLGLAWAAVHFVPEPHLRGAGALIPVFAAYGLVWGLTIREPRPDMSSQDRSDRAFLETQLPRDGR